MTPWNQYAHDVVDGTIVASKWVRLACQRHLNDLVDGHERGLWFDEVDANRFIQFFEQFLFEIFVVKKIHAIGIFEFVKTTGVKRQIFMAVSQISPTA